MTSLSADAIRALADQHPKPPNVLFQYGTAGFRTLYVELADEVDGVLISDLAGVPWTQSCSESVSSLR